MTAISRAARWAGLVLLTILPACLPARQVTLGQTQVGQGLLYQSSNPTYDKFFEEMHAVQVSAMGSLDEESKARLPLEQALGTSKTTPEQLADLAKKRAKKNEHSGAQLHLTVTGLSREKADEKVTAAISVADEAAVVADDREFVKGLGQAVQSQAELVEKFEPLAAKSRKLSARGAELLSLVSTDFTTESRRSEVLEELGAAKLILDATADRCAKISNGALSFLKVLAEALPPPGPATAVASKTDPAKTKPKKSGSKPAASPKPKPEPVSKPKTEPAAESAKPVPAPKPAPSPAKPAEDFNP